MARSTGVLQGPVPAMERRCLLAPCLKQLGLEGNTPEEHATLPSSIEINGYSLKLNSWERGVLEGLQRHGRDEWQSWWPRLADGLCFRAICGAQLNRLESGPPPSPDELDDFLMRLVTITAVGLAVKREIRYELDCMVDDHQLGAARKLSELTREIAKDVQRLRSTVSEDAFARAAAKADAMVVFPDDAVEEEPSLAEPLEERELFVPKQTIRRPSAEPLATPAARRRPARLKPLVRVLIVSLAVYAVYLTVLLLMPTRVKPPVVLGFDAFAHISSVEDVTARPPSLFVQVGTGPWARLDVRDRERVVQRIADVAGRAGYTGVLVRTTNGRTVGQWLTGNGVRVIEAAKGS